jgi:hypothetical protein
MTKCFMYSTYQSKHVLLFTGRVGKGKKGKKEAIQDKTAG